MDRTAPTPAPSTPPSRGDGMDRRLERRWPRWLLPATALTALAGVIGTVAALNAKGEHTVSVLADRVRINEVRRGEFEDFIPVRGRVTPLTTVYLDAVEGGRVEDVLIEDGAMVEAGQLLVRLSNSRLQLDVIAREAEITQQRNNLNTLELELERTRLDHKRSLVEADYQITRLQRQVTRRRALSSDGHIADEELQILDDELAYWRRRREVRLEAQASDERLQAAHLLQIRDSVAQLELNLEIAHRNLDSLAVRAPIAGKVTAFALEVGQSVDGGERLGQIDHPSDFKLAVNVDEFYSNRVDIEQRATVAVDDRQYVLAVRKLYPQVRDGQFLVDMAFLDAQPAGIRRGQTLQAKLSLGDAAPALLIPNGAFYQDTGGAWVFVVSPDGRDATRRDVSLGRRNVHHIEVIAGLEAGERIITSPYMRFADVQRLELTL